MEERNRQAAEPVVRRHYLPDASSERETMLRVVGAESVDALFSGIPDKIRQMAADGAEALPDARDESALVREMKRMAALNRTTEDAPCFLGAGAYDHFTPAAVSALAGRSEFVTAYTPYQPEMSQGLLQAIFEYQSLISGLYGMNGANASLYDGATALVEGALLAVRVTGRRRLLVSAGLHPIWRAVLMDTLRFSDIRTDTVPFDPETGRLRLDACEDVGAAAALLAQSPNFFGIAEDIRPAAELAHADGALLCVAADPVSLGVLKAPGRLGADIAVGEGQPLGLPLSFGGPYLGLFSVKEPLLRQMPGRIVGEARDAEGRRGFVLTLQAREQHIRRERAASNICTNQALCALTAAVHLSLLGPEGLRQVAQGCLDRSALLHRRLLETGLARPVYSGAFFREFLVRPVLAPARMNAVLREAGFIGGAAVSMEREGNAELPRLNPDGSLWLLAVTEKRTEAEIDGFIDALLADARIREAIG